MDLEQLVQPRDDEDLVDLGVDVGQTQLAGLGADLRVDGDQRAKCGGREMFNAGEADQKTRARLGIDECRDLLADDLNVESPAAIEGIS